MIQDFHLHGQAWQYAWTKDSPVLLKASAGALLGPACVWVFVVLLGGGVAP